METTVSDTEKAINQVVTAAYKVITFKKGTTPDYIAMKALFTPKATLYLIVLDACGMIL